MTGPREPNDSEPVDPRFGGPADQPAYPPPAYPAPAYPPASYQPVARQPVADRLGRRGAVRPAPRLGIALAGVGAALVVVGTVVWALTYTLDGGGGIFGAPSGSPGGGSRHYLGGVVALAIVLVGYALVIRVRRGPLATAGVVAGALAVPVAMQFLTLDSNGSQPNVDAVVWVSIAVWLASYLWVRGARGRAFYLGLVLYAVWAYLLVKAAPASLATSALANRSFLGGADLVSPSADYGTLAGISLTIGVAYYLTAWALDRSGRHGTGVPFLLVGFAALAVGIGALVPDLGAAGTGTVLIVVGVTVAAYGARYGHRFTTWVWSAGATLGGALIAVRAVADQGAPATGLALILLGALLVGGAVLLARLLGEPDDVPAAAEVG